MYYNDMMKESKKAFIGTSGFSYQNWHGEEGFYPKKNRNELLHYASFFNFVEINSSFYRFPSSQVFANWKKLISKQKNFIFAIKVPRFFTHMKRLKVDDQFIQKWESFWETCQILKPHLGPILLQLPPSFKFISTGPSSTVVKLKKLFQILPKKQAFVFECRNTSWQCEEVYQIFKKYNWCFCVSHVNNQSGWAGDLKTGFFPNDKNYWSTAKWGNYFRLHGSEGQYVGLYKSKTLNEIIQYWDKQSAKLFFIAFDNTDDNKLSSAIKNALQLSRKLFKHESF